MQGPMPKHTWLTTHAVSPGPRRPPPQPQNTHTVLLMADALCTGCLEDSSLSYPGRLTTRFASVVAGLQTFKVPAASEQLQPT